MIWAIAMAGLFVAAPRPLRRGLVTDSIPTLLIQAIFLAWRWNYYGRLIPNSVVAKSGGGPLYVLLGVKYALAGLVGCIGVLALDLLAVPAVYRPGTDRKFLVIYCAAWVLFVSISGGDWMPGFRYFVPVIPLLWMLVADGAGRLLAGASRGFPRWGLAAVLVVLAIAWFLDGRSLVRAQAGFPTGLKGASWIASPERVAAARELSRLVPPTATVAITECGYIPYFAPDLGFLDLFGLMDREIAHLPGRHTFKLTAAEFLRRRPDFYLMMVRENPLHEIVPTHPDGETLLASAEFRTRYEMVRSFPGFVFYRRDSLQD